MADIASYFCFLGYKKADLANYPFFVIVGKLHVIGAELMFFDLGWRKCAGQADCFCQKNVRERGFAVMNWKLSRLVVSLCPACGQDSLKNDLMTDLMMKAIYGDWGRIPGLFCGWYRFLLFEDRADDLVEWSMLGIFA